MNDFSESQTPNGGWQWLQPQTKWTLDRNSKPSSVSVTLDQASELLQKHRLQNAQFGLPTDFHAIRYEIINYNRLRLGFPPSDAPPNWGPQHPGAAAGVAGRVGKTVAGLKLIKQWLGDGMKPVLKPRAELRAETCATCPQNQKPDLFQKFDALVAREMKALIESKNSMSLSVRVEPQLQTCQACNCSLRLKVWTPLHHILNNTSPEVKTTLDARCWILHENDAG